MFAAAWYRPAERRLILARDRWGKKPLFWGRVKLDDGSQALAFSSELSLFTALPGGPPPPDPLGIARYLVYDGMPDTRTVYQGVEKLPAVRGWSSIRVGIGSAAASIGSSIRIPRRSTKTTPRINSSTA